VTDFWRTHRDTWHEQKKSFSPAQLDAVADLLVSPSYFA
jgi:hypothetical protein